MDSRPVYRPLDSSIPPAPTRKHWIEVYRPSAGERLHGYCLNQELVATYTHWDDFSNGKVRCVPSCQWCEDHEEPRWYGYMPVLCPTKGRVLCFEVTVQAARDCSRLSTKRIPLRGKLLTIGRMGERSKFGRCWATVDDAETKTTLPPPCEPLELMERVFRYFGKGNKNFTNAPLPPEAKGRGVKA